MACLPISPPGQTDLLVVLLHSPPAIRYQLSEIRNMRTVVPHPDPNRVNCELSNTGATGLEPATSRVTVECSNQTELRPQHLLPFQTSGFQPITTFAARTPVPR